MEKSEGGVGKGKGKLEGDGPADGKGVIVEVLQVTVVGRKDIEERRTKLRNIEEDALTGKGEERRREDGAR